MSVISFWSEGIGETGKTASIAAIATNIALQKNCKILIMNTKYDDNYLESCFWNAKARENRLNFREGGRLEIDSGIKGLTKAILSNKTSPEIITNYTKTVFTDRLEILTDEKILQEEYDKQKVIFKEMIKMANKYYDLVFVDMSGKIYDTITYGMLEQSDLIVACMSQRLAQIEAYMKTRAENKIINKNNKMILVSKYDDKSKYNVKNISRYIREREIYPIPYNTLFFEATNEGKVADYFIRFRKAKQTSVNGPFVHAVQKVSEDILTKLETIHMYNG